MPKKSKKTLEPAESTPNTSTSLTNLILYIFTGVAVLMLGTAMLSAVLVQRGAAQERQVQGKVVELTVRKDSDGNEFYYPVIQFSLPDGSAQEVIVPEGSWPPAYQAGQPVTVLYDPQQPLHARIKSATSTFSRWILPLITGVLGLAFLSATLLIRWIGKQVAEIQPAEVETD